MHGHSLQYMVTHCYALHSEWPSFIMIIIIKWPLCKEHASDRRRTRKTQSLGPQQQTLKAGLLHTIYNIRYTIYDIRHTFRIFGHIR